MIVSKKNRVATVRLLLKYGANINALNDELRTLLKVTANELISFFKNEIILERRLETARLLLRYEAYVNDFKTSQSALFAAICFSLTDMISLMLNANATI